MTVHVQKIQQLLDMNKMSLQSILSTIIWIAIIKAIEGVKCQMSRQNVRESGCETIRTF